MQTVLSRAAADDVALQPFPHIGLANAFDDELCRDLLAQFPDPAKVAQGGDLASNKRFSLTATDALADPAITDLWKDLISAHVSQAFLDEIVALFGDAIVKTYPDFEKRFGAIDSLRAGTRHRESFDDADVLLDAQISMNSPVTGRPTSVRGPHVDATNKLFAGLFYLRPPHDDSTGGDLELSRFRSHSRGFRGPMVYHRFVDTVKTVRYERGTLVMFLNSPRSLHGVTVRSQTDVPRYFLNLIAEVKSPLFDMEPMQASLWDKVLASPEIAASRVRQLATR